MIEFVVLSTRTFLYISLVDILASTSNMFFYLYNNLQEYRVQVVCV